MEWLKGGKTRKKKREMAKFGIKKEMNRKGKNGVEHPKAFEMPTKKNTGMDENIPVLRKDRAKTILYPYYITYMKHNMKKRSAVDYLFYPIRVVF